MTHFFKLLWVSVIILILGLFSIKPILADDLVQIKSRGVIRHLGVPYANFVTGSGDGMDVELVKLFADHIGVTYEYVKTTWAEVIGDLTGKKIIVDGDALRTVGDVTVKGDIIANGFTVLDWRKKIVDYSTPVFPTQVWLIARADSTLKPIIPTGKTDSDIAQVKAMLNGTSLMGVAGTCLDPDLYDVKKTGAIVQLFAGNLNQIAPAIMNSESDTALLDVPDALIALAKWPGKIKIIGPVSGTQEMGVAFAKTAPLLRAEFNQFLSGIKKDGTFNKLVKKYYPAVFDYYPYFFK